jgi:hypothetical protein
MIKFIMDVNISDKTEVTSTLHHYVSLGACLPVASVIWKMLSSGRALVDSSDDQTLKSQSYSKTPAKNMTGN